MPRTLRWTIALGAAAVIGAGGYFGWHAWTGGEELEERRFHEGASELIVTDLAASTLRLYRAGATLGTAVEVDLPAGGRTWLPAAKYFLRAETKGRVRWYPVPVAGYRAGPDEGGAVVVSVRPAGEFPPQPVGGSSPFVEIPAGSFLFGERANPREPHYVWLTGFFLSSFEVTNGEFRRFLDDAAGYRDPACWTEDGRRWAEANRTQCTARLRPGDADYGRFGMDDQPVVWVNWHEARAYCSWRTRMAGGGRWLFSLPTEAEWEKAARGPDGFDFALGDRISDAEADLYNWRKNPGAAETVCGREASARRYLPNRYGLLHMTGNVAEWTQSAVRPYGRDTPWREDDRNHDDTAGARVVRGGSWYSASIATMKIAYRDTFQPQHSSHDIGFRISARILP